MRPVPTTIALTSIAGALHAQSSGIRTYTNPIDVDYRYNFEQHNEKISYRQGADPVIVNHKGEYVLFMTVSDGYWHSTDLIHWRFVTPSRWPFENVVAPAALSVRDTLYLLQSAKASADPVLDRPRHGEARVLQPDAAVAAEG